MVERLTVILFILLCFLLGLCLTIFPWFNLNGDWGDNFLLLFVADKAGMPLLRSAVSSNWFRGAVTGLGILNLFIAFWELAHFNENVAMLESEEKRQKEEGKSEESL